MSTDLTGTPPAPVVRTEVGNGRGSLIVGLTVVAIALFALV